MQIQMDKLVSAISMCIDLAQTNCFPNIHVVEKITNINFSPCKLTHHAKRTSYIALQIAKILKLSEVEKQELFISSQLHDIGIIHYICQNIEPQDFIKMHCIKGSDMIRNFPFFKDIYSNILYHHENINGTGPMGMDRSNIPLISQIVRLADIVEVMFNNDIPYFKQKNKIVTWVKDNSFKIVDRDISKSFIEASSNDAFWFDIENLTTVNFILDYVKPNMDIYLDFNEFEKAAEIFSNIIDGTSPFTARHSKGISELAYRISKAVGYDEEKCHKMKVAGLLHDIGKLAISPAILNKQDKLTREEFAIIKSHVYFSKLLLDTIGVQDISDWACNHHERLNGKGYPRGLKGEELSEECRIMAVCDIYQALTEDRPYRKGMNIEEALNILYDMTKNHGLDLWAVNKLKEVICTRTL